MRDIISCYAGRREREGEKDTIEMGWKKNVNVCWCGDDLSRESNAYFFLYMNVCNITFVFVLNSSAYKIIPF